jgi:hypothetical protein
MQNFKSTAMKSFYLNCVASTILLHQNNRKLHSTAHMDQEVKGFADCKNPACKSYADMLKSSIRKPQTSNLGTTGNVVPDVNPLPLRHGCPVDKDELGSFTACIVCSPSFLLIQLVMLTPIR